MSANAVYQIASQTVSAELIALFSRASRNSSRVVVPLNDSALKGCGTGLAFYCVHPISGTVSDFLPLARLLDVSIPIYGIQVPPSRIKDPVFVSSIESVATHYVDILTTFQPIGPLALGGWSVGATIALEMAQQLQSRGREVKLLVAIEDVLTNTGAETSPRDPRYYFILVKNLIRRFGHDDLLQQGSLRLFAKRCVNRTTAWTKIAVARIRGEKAGRGHAVDGFMDASRYSPDHMTFMKALFVVGDEYVPLAYPGLVTVYAATVPPVHALNQPEAIWAKIANRAEVIRIKGLHSNLVNMPQVIPLAQHLRAKLLDIFAKDSDNTL